MHQQQETTLLVADRVHKQLGGVVGLLVMSSQFATNNPHSETITRVFERLLEMSPRVRSRRDDRGGGPRE